MQEKKTTMKQMNFKLRKKQKKNWTEEILTQLLSERAKAGLSSMNG